MPTTRRSSSTTGTAPSSVLASRSIAVRASSSGETLGTVGVHDLGGGLHRGEIIRPAGREASPRGSSRSRRWRSPTRRRRSARRRRRGRRGRGRRPPAQAAAKGSRPRARSAATIPERTSPVPAVARPGAEIALTATRSPSVTIVSSPLRRRPPAAARPPRGPRRGGARRSPPSRARAAARARRRAG